ncbi:two-component system, sensor histidine kinase YesM [Paenibacillus sp. UNCCL117]|uniref:cache domain-containing sensor histidine kinase n=1 Tax=unclassified Paenibacillus TaxID=185978 RepID=UPI000880F9E2|nr:MULTISPECIES: sensor histidine kinase [unclassified Paenibacillus]SDC91051.1 two-component system, sensor histidine kinase YesM [Paenibacillus sp. cl123]SFW28985.1 two-component system, sensor histidine kinase YesM [Paenibacillus sp. UNCCL117]
MFAWIYNQSTQKIQLRLTFYFLLLLLPLVIVSLYVNFRSQAVLLKQAEERTRGALTSSMDYIDLSLQNVEEFSTLVATDTNMLRLLHQVGPTLTAQSYVNFAEIVKQLSSLTSINHLISHVALFHSPSRMLLSTTQGGKRIERPLHLLELQTIAETKGTGIVYMMPDTPFPEDQTFGSVTGTTSISLVRTMDLNNPDREPNLLIISLNKEKLLDLIRSLLPSPNAEIYLYSDEGKLVTGTGERGQALLRAPASSAKEFTVRVDSKYYKWSLLLVQPKAELYRETNVSRLYTYVIIAVSVILALLISWAVYSGIASPVQRLMKGMKRVGGGNFSVRLENERMDEFGYLTRSFNKMVEEQRDLIENVYEQQLRLAHTELKFLQSQINPHFLYNTLDSIYWTAKNYDADEISEMVLNLSSFFRLSLGKGRETFTLEETITHLHYYIRVQQLRFLDSFKVRYELEDEAKKVPLLKLVLQPLVENAILHGLDSREDGELLVSGRVEEGQLVIAVRDNGKGIPPERLSYIRSELGQLSAAETGPLSYLEHGAKDLYGLRNVKSRIKIWYGADAELTIESEEGAGTTATIRLPLDRCKDEFRPQSPALTKLPEVKEA